MSTSAPFTSLQAIASHLGPTAVLSTKLTSLTWPRSDAAAARAVTIMWDDARRLVRIRAPFSLASVGVEHADPSALALAVAKVNYTLEVVGLELDQELAFVAHASLDADGAVASSVIDQLLTAIDTCESRVATVFAELRAVSGAS